jgi:hypothetical protein
LFENIGFVVFWEIILSSPPTPMKKYAYLEINIQISGNPTKSFAYWLGLHSKTFLNPLGFRKHFSPLARKKGTPTSPTKN